MSDEPVIDMRRLQRLEQALIDVKVIRERWAAAVGHKPIPASLDSAFSEAFDRLQEQAGVVVEDIVALTGVRGFDYGGKSVDIFTPVIAPNPMDGTEFGVAARIREIMNVEQLLNRTIGLVKAGYKPVDQRTVQEPNVSIFEQARDDILKTILERRGLPGHIGPALLADLLERPADDITDDLRLLKVQDFVILIEADQGIIGATLTPRGVQRAREGMAAAQAGSVVNLTNTFLAPVGTANIAQSGTGDVFQHVEQPSDLAEISRLLATMRQALAASDIEEDKREEGLVYIEQLTVELQQPKPRPSMLKIPWTGLGRVADIAGVTQAGMMVIEAYRQLEPLITPMLKAAGS